MLLISFSRATAKRYRCGSGISLSSTVLITMCRAKMTSRDAFVHFCCYVLGRYDVVGFLEGVMVSDIL